MKSGWCELMAFLSSQTKISSCETLFASPHLEETHMNKKFRFFLNLIETNVADADPHWDCGPGFRRAKLTHKNIKSEEISCFEVLDVVF
jgi:hypothetical protein